MKNIVNVTLVKKKRKESAIHKKNLNNFSSSSKHPAT